MLTTVWDLIAMPLGALLLTAAAHIWQHRERYRDRHVLDNLLGYRVDPDTRAGRMHWRINVIGLAAFLAFIGAGLLVTGLIALVR